MNPQRKKIFVICLAVAAVLMLLNSLRPIWQRGRPSARKASGQAPTQVAAPTPNRVTSNAPAASAAAAPTQAEAAPMAPGIELARVGWKFDGAPRRDPFQVIGPGPTNLTRLYPSATELLTLNAVWWQSGNILADVNGRIVQVGQTLKASKSGLTAEFKILNIGLERIWVQGPNGEEHILFDPTLSLRGIDVKLRDFAVEMRRLNWPYRVVNGLTNDASADPGWATFSGKVQKMDEGKYLVKSEDPPVILKNIPLDLVDDDSLPPLRCKNVGTESYTTVMNAKVTRRLYDFGEPCSPPKAVVDSLKLQKEFVLQQYSEANQRRFRLEMELAEKGDAAAQYMLGRRYLYGDGVAEDEDQGRHWLDRAAAQGNPDAQATLLILGFQK